MQKTSLICNKFSGIHRNTSKYSSSLITASDMQNIELFSTENNSGVGIRTSLGNIAVSDLIPNNEVVVNIFESIQKSKTYFFVHTESSLEGKIYLFNPASRELILKVSELTITGKSSATDVTQGWSDLWVFSNSKEMLTIEIEKYNSEGNLDEITKMTPKDMDGRNVQGLGLVIFAGRLWIFNGQILWYSAQENIYDFTTSDAEIVTSAGYIEFSLNKTTQNGGYIALENRTCLFRSFITSSSSSTHNISTYIPAKKGDVIVITYNATGETVNFRFIYAEGEV